MEVIANLLEYHIFVALKKNVPENGYIVGYTIPSDYKPRWINCSINGASITGSLGINADDSTSIPFITVKKGDKVSFDYFCSKIILYYMYGRA